MEQTMKCVICKNSNYEVSTPSCDHAICAACLYKELFFNYSKLVNYVDFNTEMELNCVVCEEGIHKISKRRISELFDSEIKKGKITLYCIEHKKEVSSFCQECKWRMCNLCLEKHNSIPPFSDHSLVKDLKLVNYNNFCPLHKDEKFKFQCTTCKTPICSICKDLYHNQHNDKLVYVNDYYKNKKDELKSIKMPFSNFDTFCNSLDEEEKIMKNNIATKSTKVIDQIQSLIESLQYLLKNYESKIKVINEELILTNNITKSMYRKLYEDIETTSSEDFLNLSLFGKFKKSFCKLKLNEDIDTNFYEIFNQFNAEIEKLKEQIIKVNNVGYNLNYDQYICIATLENHTAAVTSLISLRDGNLVSGSGDSTIKVWDSNDNYKCIATLTAHTKCVTSLLLLNDGQFVSVSSDETCKIWEPKENFKCLNNLSISYINNPSLLLLPDGKFAVWGNGASHIINIYDPKQIYKIFTTLKGESNRYSEDNISSLIVLNEIFLISSEYNIRNTTSKIKVWNLKDNFKLISSFDDVGNINFIVLSDGKLASSSNDLSSITIWNSKDNFKRIATLTEHKSNIKSLLYLSDDKFLSSAADNSIKIWDIKNNYKCLTYMNYSFSLYLLIKDGLLAAANSRDNSILIVSPEDNLSCISTLVGHLGKINNIINISNKKNAFASLSADNTIKIWSC